MNRQEPEYIGTERLDLYLISPEDLIQLFEDPENMQLPDGAPYKNSYRVLVDESGPLQWRVPHVKRDVTLNKWFIRFVVLREIQEVIGSISFHGQPDENGMIEIGLGIEEPFHNKGFATEALLGMWRWVCTQPGVQTLRYTVSPDNAPSQKIIANFGFTHKGVQIDEEDGPEDIYEMSVEEFRNRYSN